MQQSWRPATRGSKTGRLSSTPRSSGDFASADFARCGFVRVGQSQSIRRETNSVALAAHSVLPRALRVTRQIHWGAPVGWVARAIGRCWTYCMALVGEWQCRANSRSELKTLNEHDLSDIGLTLGGAKSEASKHFWVP
jgi:uncharacterized protein YjiS (DUF1127 family)